MRKLSCVIALSILLLAGCSQDEGIMESKGELVTLNYNVSLGNGVQSRAGEDLAVNKLLCTIFEVNTDGSAIEVKRDILDMTNGTAQYTPKLFSNVQYKIAFWAYCEQNGQSCFDLTDARNIKINYELYDKEAFVENKYKDAYTAAHEIKLTETKQTPSIVLNRPFGMVKVLTSKADYEAAVALGSTPTKGPWRSSGPQCSRDCRRCRACRRRPAAYVPFQCRGAYRRRTFCRRGSRRRRRRCRG